MAQLNDLLVMGQSTLLGPVQINATLLIAHDQPTINFRKDNDIYNGGISYQTSGNGAMVFSTKLLYTSFIFVNGEDISNDWQGLTTPGLQIKNNCVSIGKFISNPNAPSHKLQVNGTSLFSGLLQVNNIIFGYNYNKGSAPNAPAFVFDKPGDHYTGIGANGATDTIYFGAVYEIEGEHKFKWCKDVPDVADTTKNYKQKWKFNGSVEADTYNAVSDARLKENFQQFTSTKSILDLPIYKFDFIHGPKNQIGCKAQDLQEICPEIVNKDSDGYLSIQENKIIYLLIDEIKKLKEEIKTLKEK